MIFHGRAILISNATYLDEGIPDLPAAADCTAAMAHLLTSDLCGWPTDRVTSPTDIAAPHQLARQLVTLVKDTQDVLLLYYVGHGVRTSGGQLALALAETSADPELVPHTAAVYDAVAGMLSGSPAVTKLVILDCCHAELGNKANYQFQSADIDGQPVDGLYFIGASKRHERAKFPLSGGLTYFTNAFIEAVRTGIPGKPSQLTLDQIFTELRAKMLRANLPEPVQSGIRDAQRWPFARNAARLDTHRDPDQEIASLTQRLAESEGLRAALDAQIQALQAEAAKHATELERLKAQASTARHMTPEEKSELQDAIDTAERLLRDTIAAEAAVRATYPGRPPAAPARSAQSPGGRHSRQVMRDMTPPRLLGGRYELDGVVGRGGMAEVYRARDIRLDRIVAITTLRADLARDQIFQARFRREAHSAASLNHPSIVAVYDTGEDAATEVPVPYIVMEYVDGRTVHDLLKPRYRILPERSLEIIDGVLRALEYSHKWGIVHRDIKPGNVMVSRNGDIKVMDFGIARDMTGAQPTMTQTAQVIGTVLYMSPEQARGARVDGRSDLYSTGCVFYELLTGWPPFTGDPIAIAYQHVRENPIPPSRLDPDIPGWGDAIVLKAMAKSLAERYQTAAEIRADLQRAASGMMLTDSPARIPADDKDNENTMQRAASGRLSADASPLISTYDEYSAGWLPEGNRMRHWLSRASRFFKSESL